MEAVVVGEAVAAVVMVKTALETGAEAAFAVDPLGIAYRKFHRSAVSSVRLRATSKPKRTTRMGGLSGPPSFLAMQGGRTLLCLCYKRPDVSGFALVLTTW